MAGQVAETSARGVRTDYGREWRAYARRRNLALVLLFGVAPVGVVAYWVCVRMGLILVGIVLAVAWCGATCAAVWWAGEFRCPRCVRRFGALGSDGGLRGVWRGLFDEVCANCKLRRWE